MPGLWKCGLHCFASLLPVLLAVGIPRNGRAQAGGLPPEWEVSEMLKTLATEVVRLKPVLAEAKPQEWVSNGAPEAYVSQLKAAQDQVGYALQTLEGLTKEPDRVTLALEAFLRLQAVDSTVFSLSEGVRRYQNPALASLLEGTLAESAASREKLRQHLVDLVAVKEKEFRLVDAEAQRCRAVLTRRPVDERRRSGGEPK